jgi:two-component system, sensor histidine kinase SagS
MRATERIPFRSSLTFRQAAITLLVVLVLGLLASAFELYSVAREVKREAASRAELSIGLVQGSATAAAYQMSGDLAREVVRGLLKDDAVAKVTLKDNFGTVLATESRSREIKGTLAPALGKRVFADLPTFRQALSHALTGAAPETIGEIELHLAPDVVAARFVDRVTLNFIVLVVRDLAISAVVVAIFYFFITMPLVRLANSIAAVDPTAPGGWPKPGLSRHSNDELGLVERTVDRLMRAFQTGIDERDRAEQGLKQLTQELEARVRDRTRDLESANLRLADEKATTERAYAELDRTHHDLERANRLVVESIQYARRIQSAMLPDKRALQDSVAEIAVWWEPLHVVGGDYFWLERFDNKSLLMIVDCTGHGVPGAFITLVVASALDRVLHDYKERSPAKILAQLNELVRLRLRQDRPDADSDDGFDAAICIWDEDAKTVTFAGAGLPLLYSEGAEVKEIRGQRNGLGYSSETSRSEIEEHVLAVAPGQVFYLLTDGVPDHMGGNPARLLGRRRLMGYVSQHLQAPLEAQIEAIQGALETYRGENEKRDDMTLVCFRPLAAQDQV